MSRDEGRRESVIDDKDTAADQLTHPCDRSIAWNGPEQVLMGFKLFFLVFSTVLSGLTWFQQILSGFTPHAGRTELLATQVDGVVVLLTLGLLSLMKEGPGADFLQTLLRVPH